MAPDAKGLVDGTICLQKAVGITRFSSVAPLFSETRTRQDVFRKKDSIAAREIAGETLLVPVRGELAQLHRLFSLNPVAAFIWNQLDGVRTLGAIHALLIENFEASDTEIWQDLLEFIELLVESQLIETVETS